MKGFQQLLGILKPDILRRNLEDQVMKDIQNSLWFIPHFRISHVIRVKLPVELVESLYDEHRERPFFREQVTFMSSGEVIVFLLEGENIIPIYRGLLGATNPQNAVEGSLRKKYGVSIDENSLHASDSEASASRELRLLQKFGIFPDLFNRDAE